jgi:hypothetical protein
MSRQDIFEQAVRKYGAAVDSKTLKSGFDELLTTVQKLRSSAIFGFIDSAELNAVATVNAGHDIVGLNIGLSFYLWAYFSTLLADPDIFPMIGDPSKERINPDRKKAFQNPIESDHSICTTARPPNCSIRAHVVAMLLTCAHDFICFHELAHLELCHLDLLRSEFAVSDYVELPLGAISDEEGRMRQGLELQADTGAALTSLVFWRDVLSSKPIETLHSLDADYLWAISVYSVIFILERARYIRGNKPSITHPTPLQRFVNIFAAVSNENNFRQHGTVPLQESAHGAPFKEVMNWWLEQGLIGTRETVFDGKPFDLKVFLKEADELEKMTLSDHHNEMLEKFQRRRGPPVGWVRR